MENKRLALAVCVALTTPNIAAAETFSGIAALNLGDINSKSYLDERFKGSVPILYTTAEEASQLKVRLASSVIFRELGVDKFPILNSFSFKIKIASNGKPYVAIRSKQAIDLPFLSFVIEIYGAEGSIYQDYTVLLDPRSYVSSHVSNAQTNTTSVNPKRSVSVTKKHPKRVRVQAGDSLSGIASSVKLSQISNKRMARAIFLKNPRAFSGNNANKLKKGVTLKIPTLKEINKPQLAVTKTVEKASPKVQPTSTAKPAQTAEVDAIAYKVKSGDTLSAISRKHTSKSGSFSKMMTAIHAENPHAFTNNKVNLLKKGATLRIPTGKLLKKAHRPYFEKTEDVAKNKPKESTQERGLKNKFKAAKNTYKVIQGDTLGEIVSRLGYKRSESAQAMRAIYRKNKKAFNNKDITSLKSGAILQLLKKGDAKKIIASQREVIKTTKTLESTIINSLNSLEKRLRELRKELKSSQSTLYDLNLTLKNKDALLERQSKDIRILKKKLADRSNVENNNAINDATAKVVSGTDKEASPNRELSPRIITEINEAEQETSTAEIITYSGLAFFIGLMLLRVGRQKYAEHRVAADDYVPTAKVEPLMERKKLDFTDTLVKPIEKKTEINEASIQECERLVEELVDELDYKLASTHHDNQVSNKVDKQYLKTLQEEHQAVSQKNIVIENPDFKQLEKNIEKESDILKEELLNSLEGVVEEKLQADPFISPENSASSNDKLVTLEIDLERHLQSINDQIVANKMKDLV